MAEAEQIRAISERLGDIAQHLQAVDADREGPLYEAPTITVSYEHATRTATVRSRPSRPYRYSVTSASLPVGRSRDPLTSRNRAN